MATKSKSAEEIVDIVTVTRRTHSFFVLGLTPFIFHAFSEKAKRELLYPSGRKNTAERQQSVKHDPIDEFRNSVYRNSSDQALTRLCFPSSGFKGAICEAAVDMPGAYKSKLRKHIYVENNSTNIYGIPKLFMVPARSSDMNHTPDIRTRAILPNWCAELSISYLEPYIRINQLANLLVAAGLSIGVGDDRQEKGKGGYGQFTLVNRDDPRILDLFEHGSCAAQDEALETAIPYDADSEALLHWYETEFSRRHDKISSPKVKLVG